MQSESLRGQKWAVIGGSSWVGANVIHFARNQGVELSVFGSQGREAVIAGKSQQIHPYETDAILGRYFDYVWDCAFVSKARLHSNPNLSAVNDYLAEKSIEIFSQGSYSSFVYFSSGAAIAEHEQSSYGRTKRYVESELSKLNKLMNNDLKLIRLWSISGPFCPRPLDFALTSMILEAKKLGKITLKSNGLVWRRYASIEQIIELVVSAQNLQGPLDSGGPLIEMLELAENVAQVMDRQVHIENTRINEIESQYFARDMSFELLLLANGITPMGIRQQILKSELI
jgi:nucleoside-diphosphate-sugar epimerase